jgi:hypothetical protein
MQAYRLNALREQGQYVCHLVALLGRSQPNISQHLTVLRAVGLVLDEREGNRILYRLNNGRVLRLLDLLAGGRGETPPAPRPEVWRTCPCPRCTRRRKQQANEVNDHRLWRWLVMAHLEGALTQQVAGRSWPKSRRVGCHLGRNRAPIVQQETPQHVGLPSFLPAHSTSGSRLLGRMRNQPLGIWGQVVPASTTMPHLLVEPLPVPLPEAVASETSDLVALRPRAERFNAIARHSSHQPAVLHQELSSSCLESPAEAAPMPPEAGRGSPAR